MEDHFTGAAAIVSPAEAVCGAAVTIEVMRNEEMAIKAKTSAAHAAPLSELLVCDMGKPSWPAAGYDSCLRESRPWKEILVQRMLIGKRTIVSTILGMISKGWNLCVHRLRQ